MRIYFLIFTIVFLGCERDSVKEESDLETAVQSSDTVMKTKSYTYFESHFEDTVLTVFPGETPKQITVNYKMEKDLGVEVYPKGEVIIKDINLYTKKKLILPDGFSAVTSLKRLYSSNLIYMYPDEDYNDSLLVSRWKCKTCGYDTIPYMDMVDDWNIFPDTVINTTFVNGDYSFTLKNKGYRLISFATYNGDEVISFTGRFSGALMGYALFKKQEAVYQLVAFEPCVGYFGTFNNPKEPEIRIAFDQLFLIYEVANGGGGGTYAAMNKVFTFQNGRMRQLTNNYFLLCSNKFMQGWSSQYQFYKDESSLIPGLKIVTTGNLPEYSYDSYKNEKYIFFQAPEALRRRAHFNYFMGLPFEFRYERKYSLNEKDSVQYEELFQIRPAKGQWITQTDTIYNYE